MRRGAERVGKERKAGPYFFGCYAKPKGRPLPMKRNGVANHALTYFNALTVDEFCFRPQDLASIQTLMPAKMFTAADWHTVSRRRQEPLRRCANQQRNIARMFVGGSNGFLTQELLGWCWCQWLSGSITFQHQDLVGDALWLAVEQRNLRSTLRQLSALGTLASTSSGR